MRGSRWNPIYVPTIPSDNTAFLTQNLFLQLFLGTWDRYLTWNMSLFSPDTDFVTHYQLDSFLWLVRWPITAILLAINDTTTPDRVTFYWFAIDTAVLCTHGKQRFRFVCEGVHCFMFDNPFLLKECELWRKGLCKYIPLYTHYDIRILHLSYQAEESGDSLLVSC